MDAVIGRTATASKKVMLIADPNRESVGALQWALMHSLLDHDELILLYVEPGLRRHSFSTLLKRTATVPNGATFSTEVGGEYDFLDELRMKCEAIRPKLQVHIERVDMEGRDKASTILLQTKVFSVDLLVVGQRSQSFLARKLSGSLTNKGIDASEYLIEHSKCPCVGVQKKGQNGGYVLNTKTLRNFWLLA